MISHERAEQLISARMDAPLSPAEHYELQSHLAACPTCRVFVSQADDIARGLQGMSRLPASPAVSRAVMSAVREEQSGWAWLSQALQALSSPGMAAAASMALIVAMAGVLYVAINAPERAPTPTVSQGTGPVETIAAVAEAPLPTAIPTQIVETPEPEEPASQELASAPTKAPEPTATRQARAVEPAATKAPTVAPTPVPTIAPVVTQEQPPIQPVTEAPVVEPVYEEPVYDEPAFEEPTLAMAEAPVEETAPVEIAQEAVIDDVAPVEDTIDTAPVEDATVAQATEPEPVVEQQVEAPVEVIDESGQKDSNATAAEPDEPEPTRPVGPLPLEAIAALEGAGQAPDINLPPAPLNPIQPDQSFLPVTPTPVSDGTPTPEQGAGESTSDPTGSEAPQLAETYEGDQPVTAWVPDHILEDPALAEAVVAAPEDTWTETSESRNRNGKKDRDRKKGDSYENQQTAYVEQPLAWTGVDTPLLQHLPAELQQQAVMPAEMPQEAVAPVEIPQETGYPVQDQPVYSDPVVYDDPAVYDDGTGYDDPAIYDEGAGSIASSMSGTESATTADDAPQIDPVTGMEIDPATGYLIDPTTGYLLDRVNGRVIDPRTSYEVHIQTGLLIDPATGALLDPNTLVVVVPAGFGSDTPAYNPGNPNMRGQIETVVDDNYNNASIRMEPPTDGPVQPIGEIIVPTETGEAVEIS
jgi:hypothetical protein